jgi:hypothetical protein
VAKGQSSNDGVVSVGRTVDGKPLHVIATDTEKVIRIGTDWKTTNELESSNMKVSGDMAELIGSQTPANELKALIGTLSSCNEDLTVRGRETWLPMKQERSSPIS